MKKSQINPGGNPVAKKNPVGGGAHVRGDGSCSEPVPFVRGKVPPGVPFCPVGVSPGSAAARATGQAAVGDASKDLIMDGNVDRIVGTSNSPTISALRCG
jgi:hypothetical protein